MNQDTLWKNYQLAVQKLNDSAKFNGQEITNDQIETIQNQLLNALKAIHQLEYSINHTDDLRIVHEVEEETEPSIQEEEEITVEQAAEGLEEEVEKMVSEFIKPLPARAEETSIAERLQKTAIKDLTNAIGISEKFLYMNELFEGDSDLFKNCLATINNMSTMQEAEQYLEKEFAGRFKWDGENKYVQKFYGLIERKFM